MEKIRKCEVDWRVTMSGMEFMYLQDQRTERKMECDRGVDPVWSRSVMRKQRQRELQDIEYVRQRDKEFRGKSLEQMDGLLESTGEIPVSSS